MRRLMRDKVSVALANAKIEANAIADRIDANRKMVEDMSLFPDFASVCTKAPEDFSALLSMRIAQRVAAQQTAAAEAMAALPKVDQNHTERALEMVEQPASAIVKESLSVGPTLKLGEINARLGYTVSAEFLASLGFVATTERNAKLYRESEWPTICRKIADHTMSLAFKKAA